MYSRGRPPKLRSIEPIIRGKKPTLRLPIHDIRYDKTGHWPEMQKKKKKNKKTRCRLCDMACRATYEKCSI